VEVEIHENVFNEIYLPYLEDVTPIQIFYGGASSGKSVFLAQRVVWDLLHGGRNYLVCREISRTIRGSVAMEIGKVISSWNVGRLFQTNKTDGTITCENGYQCVFTGLDDVEKLKSITPAKGVFTDAWVEEATETDKASIMQILKRQRGGTELTPKRLTMSFNPILQSHWLYTDYFKEIAWNNREYRTDEISILKTTYKDNRFLTKQDTSRLESERDKYRYDVYTLGEWGVLGNVIFTNWSVRDLADMRDQFTNHRNGLDFGYSADPAAIGCSHYDKAHKTIYIYDELYQSGLTNDKLAEEIKRMIGNQAITCDSAEPKSIAELRKYGVNARAAAKGKDSVLHGIQWLQQQTIVIDTKCINARNEFQGYKWEEDKGGVALPVPVDQDNHFIDNTRYAYEGDMVSSWVMSRGDE
jgi:phage terminase large subunit